MLRSILLAFCILAAAPAAGDCTAAEHRQFDFWTGQWDVADAAGKPAGSNEIIAEQGGCVLIERWRSGRGGTGLSMNFYDPRRREWRQHWVSPELLLDMTGGLENESMVLEGPLQYLKEGRVTLLRGTWTPLPDGRVRQHFVESTDGGRTWKEWFDGYYERSEAAED